MNEKEPKQYAREKRYHSGVGREG